MKKTTLKFSLSLVAVIALIAAVVGVVAGRASSGSSASSGGGSGGAAAGKKVDVIIKASDSSFWQTMLAGAQQGRRRLRPQGRPVRPDVGDRRQPAGPARRELDLARRRRDRARAELLRRAQQRDQARPRRPGSRSSLADTRGHDADARASSAPTTSRPASRRAQRMCELAKEPGKSRGDGADRVLGRRHPDAQGPRRRASAPASPALPGPEGRVAAVQQQRPQHRGQPGQRRRSPPTRTSSAIFADNNTSGTGAARAIKDNKAADRIPVVAFDTDPQENAALADGSIDALVVQNPYFFGYQGVVEAGDGGGRHAAAAEPRPGRGRRGQGEHAHRPRSSRC